MKLFQQLLVAPAALGLMAPMAANAADLNIQGVSDYTASGEQVTSISQFQDVYPTDWAYQALSNLIERYGCVAGYPSGSYLGNRAMTRYEAAALLNACLDRITEVTDETRRLLNEFEQELAVIKGRVDGLEARVGTLEAQQFSTTTKLVGQAHMVLGGTSYTGDETDELDDPDGEYAGTDALTFNYTLQLDLNTSFSGKDLLYTRLKSGNFADSAFGGKGYTKASYLNIANSNQDTLKVDKLWYTFPIGDEFTAWIGAKIENYYMIGSAPSIYQPILKAFKLGGNYGVYGASTGQGAGLAWKQQVDDPMDARFGVSANYVNKYGYKGSPEEGGIGTDNGKGKFLAKIDYGNPQWQVSAAYAYTQKGMTQGFGTSLGDDDVYSSCHGTTDCSADANGFAFRAYWQPEDSGLIPSVSLGYDLTDYNLPDSASDGTRDQAMAWFAGLMWNDAFLDGNTLGAAVSELQWVTAVKGDDTPDDGNMAFELWYKFQVTDNISVTPAVFYLSRPFGEQTGSSYKTGGAGADTFGTFGGLVKTSFKF